MKDDLNRFLWSMFIGFSAIYLLNIISATLEHTEVVESRSNRLSEPVILKNSGAVVEDKAYLSGITTSHHKPQVLASYKTPKWKQVIDCESDWRHYNESGYLLEGDQHLTRKAYGIAQFQIRTFRELKIKAGKPELRIENKDDQIWLLKWAIKNGYGKKWSCY